jgi:hypothetical protein
LPARGPLDEYVYEANMTTPDKARSMLADAGVSNLNIDIQPLSFGGFGYTDAWIAQ